MTAGDRHQVGAVSEISLVGTLYGGSPIRGTADHRRRQNPSDIAVNDEVLGVVDCRRYLALQPHSVADALSVCRIAHPDGFVGVTAERPLTIDMLPGLDCGHDRQVVIGHLHADRDQIDGRISRELLGVRKRERDPEMLSRCVGRILPRCTNSADLKVRKRLQGWDMGNRGKPTARICSDNPHADLSVRYHRCLSDLRQCSHRISSSMVLRGLSCNADYPGSLIRYARAAVS